MKADLHSHTISSDGVLTYEELIQRAKANHVDVLAISNHDSLDLLKEAHDYAKKEGMDLIYAVELSTYTKDESVHILGYFKELTPQLEELKKFLIEAKLNREKRAKKMLALLKEYYGFDIPFEAFQTKGTITRGNMANEIVRRYPNIKKEELFSPGGALNSESKAYLPSTKLSTEQGVALLKRANALIVLAHPTLLKINSFEDILKNNPDIEGIEGRYPLNKENQDVFYKEYALRNGLIFTAGSDFHSPNDPSHGEVGQCTIEGKELENFYNKLK